VRRILVTGGGGSAAANFVRSLRLADEPFYVVATDRSPYHLELSPADVRYVLPPASDPAYLEGLNAVIERERIELVHPQPDVEVFLLSLRRADLAAPVFLPAHPVVELCQDKAAASRALEAAGVPVPLTVQADSEGALRDAVERILERHAKAWVRAARGAGARAALPVSSPEQASAWARYWVELRGLSYRDFMASAFLPGGEFAFQSVWKDGELVTSAARERLVHLFGHVTPSGQTSTPSVARTVHRADVNAVAVRAVRAVDPEPDGVYCVDLREDERGVPRVTEVNAGRFFTTSNFLAEAGANMPHDYVRLALGEEVGPRPPLDAVPAGLYWVRMVDMGFKLVREGEWSSLPAPSGAVAVP
jgi:glutathione synthase/RimK-type ligase-like ATP-grasp enzyme